MTPSKRWQASSLNWEWLGISTRTALAAVVSLLAARLLKLPQAYWAPITAIVVIQSRLGTAGVFVLGLLSAALHIDRSAYRFAGITVTIVMLIPGGAPPWVIGLHRFTEVSVGILVGLLLTAVWPEGARQEVSK
jgi:uncharacterized membrane protein YccC